MARYPFSSLEPLEARIAPAALAVLNPLSDLVAGVGKTGATVDLGHMFEDPGSQRTLVEFTTNFDTDPNTPGLQAGKIVIELFDDKAPLTVQNFLGYVNNQKARGDYDGTFFHRAAFADLDGNGSKETPFVLQGGAYEVSDLTNHIPTAPPVHNEYGEYGMTPESNVRGTVALAKTALGPNTGTSEFFFNLSDNSSNLDQQNGGFTVFGRVVQGMDVVDAIAALQKWNFGSLNGNGALSEVPAQGYHADPDGNSQTGSPLPSANQLVQITDAKVLPAQNAHHDGVTYSVSITDGNGNPSKLVTGKLTGDTLQLAYKPGATGVAKVTVTAQHGSDVVVDEFDVVVKPNLIMSSAGDTLPEIIIPGNKGVAKVSVTNTGAGMMNGKVDVKFYLSEISAQDPGGFILGPDDVEIGGLSGKALKLASGKSMTLSGKVTVPETLALESGKQYRVLAQVTTPDGSSVTELFTDDNVAVDGRVHAFVNGYGTNLVAYAADSTISGIAVPGDTGTGKVLVHNNTGQVAKGKVDVKFYMSPIENTGAWTTASDDVLIGSIVGKNVSIPAGKSSVLSGAIQLPTDLVQVQGELFRVIAVVTPSVGSTIGEFTPDDNGAYDVSVHGMFNVFGTFSAHDPGTGQPIVRKNVALSYTDANDHLVKVSLTKGGYGEISLDTNGDIEFLKTFYSSANSTLSVKTPIGESTSLKNIVTDSFPLGTVSMGNVDITGDVFIAGGVKSLTLGNLADPAGATHNIGIGQFTPNPKLKTNIRLGTVTDYRLESLMPVNSLAVATWENQNATQETILVHSMTNFVSQQNLEASMGVVNPVKVKSFTVGGTLSGAQVDIFGDVGSIKLGAMQDSEIFVGRGPGNQIRTDAVLGSFTIKGAAGASDLMANSRLFVPSFIGTVNIQSVDPDSGIDSNGAPREFGIITHAIKSYNRDTVHLKNLIGKGDGTTMRIDEQNPLAQDDYLVQLV